MYSTFIGKVLYPAIELVERRQFLSILDWYNKCQYLPYEELKAHQEEKLRQLIRHAYENVPFYREKFESVGLIPTDIRTIEDLHKLPITTKMDIRKNFPGRMVAKSMPSNRLYRQRTSGSSGIPVEFYLDIASWDHARASYLLFNEWTGIRPGDRYVWIGNLRPSSSPKTRFSHLLLRERHICVADLNVQNMLALLSRLARTKPRLIGGIALPVFRLAQLAREANIEIRPKAVVSTAEKMPSRYILEKAFGCPVFDRYGNRELNGYLAQNCSQGHSLHVNTELCILEVVDNKGEASLCGKVGNIILTDLTNYAMPFIRYDPEDMAMASCKCSCSRGFPLIGNIEGRRIESLITRDGRLISCSRLGNYLFLNYHGYIDYFLKYQAEQNELDRITFRFVPLKTVDEEVKQQLYHDLRELLGEGVEINIEFVDDILPEASGKQLIIKSSLSGQQQHRCLNQNPSHRRHPLNIVPGYL
ncbi:phenylacetate--CoA ligase family protein [Chloroflexota bacterium]